MLSKKIRIVTLLAIFLWLAQGTTAQKTDLGNWFIYFGNQKISERWNWWNEVQYRNYNFAGDLEQLLLRTAIGYDLTPNNNNFQLGYAFIHSEPYISGKDQKRKENEHRIYQQFLTRQNFGRVYIQHRYRFEQRFTGDVFRMRLRYFLSVNIPVNKKVMAKNSIYLSAYNEIFANVKSPVFDRDRLYGGIGYALTNSLRIETGLMYQIQESRYRPQWQIMFFNNLSLYHPSR